MESIPATARLRLDKDALVQNWQTLDRLSGTASAGAAVKANAYGLGARNVTRFLIEAGCHDFYVANWREAAEISELMVDNACLSVLNGIRDEDMAFALNMSAKPVLNSIEQVRRWAPTGRPCDIMINSGMNRLGINRDDLEQADLGTLAIDQVMSHMASADEDVSQNADQLAQFRSALESINGQRVSLANSAAIALGSDYHFDCTRPGLSIYGGKPRPELESLIQQVATPQAQILQVRELQPGDKLGYNAQYTAQRIHRIAILAMGYADGYLRAFSNNGQFSHQGNALPVLGRVSMDLIAVDLSADDSLREGGWLDCSYDLLQASRDTGLSQYELLTNLGQRFDENWI
ncbi:alanine racemase [Parasphingorhabdus sp.]